MKWYKLKDKTPPRNKWIVMREKQSNYPHLGFIYSSGMHEGQFSTEQYEWSLDRFAWWANISNPKAKKNAVAKGKRKRTS